MLKTASGSTGLTPTYTYTTLPPASGVAASVIVFVSDWGASGTFARSNGSRWLPLDGQTVLKRMGAAVSGIANTETIACQVQLPIGAIQAGDMFRVITSPFKSGTTDTLVVSLRVGTAGTVADTALTGLSSYVQLAAASQSAGPIYGVRILSTTSMQRTGAGGANNSPYGSVSAIAPVAATTGLPDSSANAIWFTYTLKSGGTTDTVGVQECTIIQEAG